MFSKIWIYHLHPVILSSFFNPKHMKTTSLVTTDAKGRLRYKGKYASWFRKPDPRFGGGTIKSGEDYFSLLDRTDLEFIAWQVEKQEKARQLAEAALAPKDEDQDA